MCKPSSYLFKVFKEQEGLDISWEAQNIIHFFLLIATFDKMYFRVWVWCNLQFGTIYSNHDYFYSMQLIFYYIRRKKNEFQCSSIGVGNWSLIKNIFLVFSSSSSIFFQKISSNRRTHYGNTGYGVSKSGDTAKSKLERRQFST